MFELKMDPKFPHHYIIGVATKPMTAGSMAGKLFLKYGPVYFINDDVKKVQDACVLTEDKIYKDIYKMKNADIYRLTGCTEVVLSLIGLQMSAEINQVTLHHFSSEVEIPDVDSFFVDLVERANNPESNERKKLNDSRINTWKTYNH